jgi:hypothetical protein
MVHEKNKKVDYSLQRKFFHQEKRSSCDSKALRFREPELLYKEDIKAEKSGVVTEIDNRRPAKLQTGCTTR